MSGVPELADYKYGFHEDVTPVYETGMGLSEEVVRTISQVKNEPQWMLEEPENMRWVAQYANANMGCGSIRD